MQWAAKLYRRLVFRRPEFTPTRKSPLTEYAAIALFYSVGQVIRNPTVFTIFSTLLMNWKLKILNIDCNIATLIRIKIDKFLCVSCKRITPRNGDVWYQ